MARAIVDHDWSASPVGPISDWPPFLVSIVGICLNAAFPTAVLWGSDLRLIYNDSYAPFLGPRHPGALGLRYGEVWSEVWNVLGPQFETVFQTGAGVAFKHLPLTMTRSGYPEETFWDYSFSPLFDEGRVAAVLVQAQDATETVQQHRYDSLLIALDERLLVMDGVDDMVDTALEIIGEHLRVKRSGFGEIDPAEAVLTIRRCWVSGDMPDICGRYPLGTFGPITGELSVGKSVTIEDNLRDPRTSDPQTLRVYESIGLRSGIVVPILERGEYRGGIFVQDNVPRHWTDPEIALAEKAAARLWQAILRARAQASLRDSEERFRLIFEQANDIIFTADIDQRLTAANPAGARALGYEPAEIVGRSIADFVSPRDFEQTTAMLRQKIDNGGHTRHEVTVTGRDGKPMRWENDSTLVVDRDSKPIGLLSISRDVTERRAFDERRDLLIHELNHRVKNTLALVQGLALQSFRNRENEAGDFLSRLRALASAHDLLTQEHWEQATMHSLVSRVIGALGGQSAQVESAGPDVTVAPRAAVPIVMALHELITNAVKYGALSTPAGRVALEWGRENARLHIKWQERGGPKVAKPEKSGFGIKMIERALASDLRGSVLLNFEPDGVICTIDAPVVVLDK